MSQPPGSGTPAPDQRGKVGYFVHRVRKHVQWARTEGIGRLIEEDRLDPRERIGTAVAKARWRREHDVAIGSALPVYVVGLQRSGTNMLLRGLDSAPEVEVRGENDKTLFHRFRLRSDDILRATLRRSRHAIVLVKPLCDSQRVDQLLDLPGVRHGRAIWAYRDVDDRARSELSKFGSSNLDALRRIAGGESPDPWQGERLGDEARALIRSFDYDTMTPDTAAALFWYVRNGLYFDLGLDERDDVLLSSYDALVADPETSMRELCAFIDFPCRPQLWQHVAPRSTHGRRPLDIDPRVRDLCDQLTARLEAARLAQAPGSGAGPAAASGPVPDRMSEGGR
jgi:hypothetical protein